MARRAFAALGVAAGAVAGAAFLRRGASRRRERVDLYFDDGSMISLADGSPRAERLLALARQALDAVS